MPKKILRHERMGRTYSQIREAIVREIDAHGRSMSPSELSKALGMDLSNVSYHVTELKKAGALKPDRTEPVRGAVEHFYYVAPGVLVEPDVDGRALDAIADLLPTSKRRVGLLREIAEIIEGTGRGTGRPA